MAKLLERMRRLSAPWQLGLVDGLERRARLDDFAGALRVGDARKMRQVIRSIVAASVYLKAMHKHLAPLALKTLQTH